MNKVSKKIIVGLGNPILDISNKTTKDVLDKFGLIYNQTIFANDSNVEFYDVLENSPNCSYIAGGSVTNTIRVCNWMMNGHPDVGCMMIGCVGKDNYGDIIKKELNKVNVDIIFEECETDKTSRCACGIVDNIRCLLPQVRASSKLSKSFVDGNLEKILKAEILFVEGYFLIEGWNIVELLVAEFEMSQKKIGFTLSAVFMVETFFDKIKNLADSSDFIFGNEDEVRAFVKMLGFEPSHDNKDNAKYMFAKLEKNENRILILTHGAEPTTVCSWDYEKNDFKILIVEPVYPISKESIEDTNGCGDSLVGGFMCEYLKGSDLKTCLKAGQYAAYVVLQNIGCTYPEKPDFKI